MNYIKYNFSAEKRIILGLSKTDIRFNNKHISRMGLHRGCVTLHCKLRGRVYLTHSVKVKVKEKTGKKYVQRKAKRNCHMILHISVCLCLRSLSALLEAGWRGGERGNECNM